MELVCLTTAGCKQRPDSIGFTLIAIEFFEFGDGKPGGPLPVTSIASERKRPIGVLSRIIHLTIPQECGGQTSPQFGVATIQADGTL